ncbi:MAG TPA: DUF3846 domain-containing protein [Arthrobacter sp.]
MKVAIIPADSTQPFRFEDMEPGLKPLQDAVGGDIELVGIRNASMNMYLNEDGKPTGLPANARATELAHRFHAIRADDYITGDIVLVGPFDEDGGDTDLTAEHVALLELFQENSPFERESL